MFNSLIRKKLYAAVEPMIAEAEKAFQSEKETLQHNADVAIFHIQENLKTDIEQASNRHVKEVFTKLIN